jgi:hypothetical protein
MSADTSILRVLPFSACIYNSLLLCTSKAKNDGIVSFLMLVLKTTANEIWSRLLDEMPIVAQGYINVLLAGSVL